MNNYIKKIVLKNINSNKKNKIKLKNEKIPKRKTENKKNKQPK